MEQTSINIRVDEDIKKEVEILFADLGRKHVTLKERLKNHDYSSYKTEECDTGESVGREVL